MHQSLGDLGAVPGPNKDFVRNLHSKELLSNFRHPSYMLRIHTHSMTTEKTPEVVSAAL